MRFDQLGDWLNWLESHHPTDIELGLDRVGTVADRLGLRAPRARVITIAGTNGKGTCVEACAALLRAAGERVGAYTSPHLLNYHERIRIDGTPVSDAELCRSFARIDAASTDISLTYFEFGTLAALDRFREHEVDVMVLEVGLGGRLDAVNILDADVAVVTSVDLDHQNWLGNDRDSIGREKAGIYRAGRPALCADHDPPEGLLQAARALGVRPLTPGRAFGHVLEGERWRWWGRGADGERQSLTLAPPELPRSSLAAALEAVTLLGYAVAPLAVAADLSRLSLPGRHQQRWWRERQLVLDVAHNPAAAAHLARRLGESPFPRTHIVVGMMGDKDWRGTLSALLPVATDWWPVSLPSVPRAASGTELAGVLIQLGARPRACDTVATALEALAAQSAPGERIVVMGSFYTVGDALEVL